MSWLTEWTNNTNRGVTTASRTLDRIFPAEESGQSLTVTCGDDAQRAAVFRHILARCVNAGMPAVVLYAGDAFERQLRLFGGVRYVNFGQRVYSPLYGMTADEALQVLKMEFRSSAHTGWQPFERAALEAYVYLLWELNYPITLDNLLWLVRLESRDLMAVIRQTATDRLTAEQRARRCSQFAPWLTQQAGMTVSVQNAVLERVQNLQDEVAALWTDDHRDHRVSILAARNAGGVLAIRIDSGRADGPGCSYLAKELEFAAAGGAPFLLACCDVILPGGSEMNKLLQTGMRGPRFVCGRHLPLLYDGMDWTAMIGTGGQLLILNCGGAGAGETYTRLLGNYLETIETERRGRSRRLLELFGVSNVDVTVSERWSPKVSTDDLTRYPRGGVLWSRGADRILVIPDLHLEEYYPEAAANAALQP